MGAKLRPEDKKELRTRIKGDAMERVQRKIINTDFEEIATRDELEEDEELLRDEMDYAGRMTPEEEARKRRLDLNAERERFKQSLKKAPR